jgi:hypothetical protein
MNSLSLMWRKRSSIGVWIGCSIEKVGFCGPLINLTIGSAAEVRSLLLLNSRLGFFATGESESIIDPYDPIVCALHRLPATMCAGAPLAGASHRTDPKMSHGSCKPEAGGRPVKA